MSKHWLSHPKTIKKLWFVMLCILFFSIFIQFFFPVYGHFEIEQSFGFGAWFGFLTCVLMIVAAKLLGFLIKRPDNYYESNKD
jgi:uncharacterized membrane protein YdjX (TVP38/TMEM64 family)